MGCSCGKDHDDHRESGKASFDAVLEIASENDDAVVVHGWVRDHCRWLAYAWCEFGEELVVDLTAEPSRMDRAQYYERNEVAENRLIRYSRLEYFTLVADKGHFGPFDEILFPAMLSEAEPPTLG